MDARQNELRINGRPDSIRMEKRIENSHVRASLNIVNTCPEDVMSEARRKIGIAPVTAEKIREWVVDEDAKENDTDTKLFKSNFHHQARFNAALTFLEDKLHIPFNEIDILDVKMCRNPEKGILWLECNENLVKRIFYKASILQDQTIRTVQYTPHETFKRKVAIDDLLKGMREKESNLKTQVRPGKDDWEVRLKKSSKDEYDSWDIVTVDNIEPEGEVSRMDISTAMRIPKSKNFLKRRRR